jgi:hypothetical protein
MHEERAVPATPQAQALVALWYGAATEHPIDRALSLLEAFTGRRRDELAALPLHHRDALLMACRQSLRGRAFEGMVTCPACGCAMDAKVVLPAASGFGESRGRVEVGGRAVAFRVPDSRDLAAAALTPGASGRALLARCVDDPAVLDDDAMAAAVDAAIAALCDATEHELLLACAECDQRFAVPVDVAGFLWHDVGEQVERLLDDVDLLARCYGWSEAEVLALPARRRARYVERCS